MAPCGVIFHENVVLFFVAEKCSVILAYHKTHKQYEYISEMVNMNEMQ